MLYLTGMDDDFNLVKEPRCPTHPLPWVFLTAMSSFSYFLFTCLLFFFLFLSPFYATKAVDEATAFFFCPWAS